MYHVCFSLGRFPFELPAGLPDEQIDLMLAYMAIVREESDDHERSRVDAAAMAGEARLQAEESAAWATQRKAVTGRG